MSKSILVIDTPKFCEDCMLLHDSEFDGKVYEYRCALVDYKEVDMEIVKKGHKPDWCPLKELPERKKLGDFVSPMEDMKVVGWNACLDEILNGGYIEE